MPELFQTQMGKKFYDSTLPRIAEALEGIANNLQAFLDINKKLHEENERLKREVADTKKGV